MELVLKDTQIVLSVSDTVFKRDFNKSLVHQVIVSYKLGGRQGSCAQKSRGEVTGSGKKPWRQKGTGRARAGSVKSPIWRSGGVTFAAKQQDYDQKINKKMYRGALKSILSELVRQNRFIVVENFFIEESKTKLLVRKLKNMNLDNVLIVTTDGNNDFNRKLFLSSRNLHKVEVRDVINIDPVSLIAFNKIVMTVNAVKKIEEMLL